MPLLGAPMSNVCIQFNPRLGMGLVHTIRLDFRKDSLNDGSGVNQCVRAMTNASTAADWRGPIIAYIMGGEGRTQDRMLDMSLSDFGTVVDYFKSFMDENEETKLSNELLETQFGFQTMSLNPTNQGTSTKDPGSKESTSKNNNSNDLTSNNSTSKDSTSKDSASEDNASKKTSSEDTASKKTSNKDTVVGVRINSNGDFQLFHRPMFESVEVPLSDPIFEGRIGKERWTSDIAHLLGIPLLTRQYPKPPEWSPFGLNDNQQATFLHLNCKDRPGELFGWGWVPEAWQAAAGSTLVIRQDGKPLHPLHIEALAEYCATRVQSLFETALERSPSKNANDPRTMAIRNAALAQITREDFELNIWPEALVRNRQEGGAPVESPFDI
ncbi:hypothetical protein HDK90DRAFT_279494 [Phyllosticta capitalensis]|uniref:Uncharacterized protein n=1 Tax=Phyllosticta capitalensis TaxID=121624 RepID=A0ABR1YMW0_9PEZI